MAPLNAMVPGGLEVLLFPAVVVLLILVYVGRILYREVRSGYETETAEE